MKLRPIMFVGTGSHAGKSLLATGFCRLLRQDGYRPAPFKAQNMSLNSYATPEGLELARAQAVQAEAAGIPCHVDMNPVLLKPTSEVGSQLVVRGRPVGNRSAYDYFMGEDRHHLFEEALAAFHRLAVRYHPIVLEGAGSISELNLKHRDITNLRMALATGAAAYLVADIDRGGVFGSVYGSVALLEADERAALAGIIINKFRGDVRLFAEGVRLLEDLTEKPVLGVVPYLEDLQIDAEDSVSLFDKARTAQEGPLTGKVNVAVVRLPRLSNFTDFDVLERDPRVHLFYTDRPEELARADLLLLPGSKNTIDDLLHLKRNGAAEAIVRAARRGVGVVGVCGGFQMMGASVADPDGIESRVAETAGLDLLPVRTVLEPRKTTRQRTFRYRDAEALCTGYEIHMGRTEPLDEPRPVNTLSDGRPDGYFLSPRCWGTYLHGIFDNPVVVEDLLADLAPPGASDAEAAPDPVAFREAQYDRLADHLREHLDLAQIYAQLRLDG